MSLPLAIVLSDKLLAFVLLIQAVEIFIISRRFSFRTIWSYKNLASDLEKLPLPKSVIQKLFSNSNFSRIALLQMILATLTVFVPFFPVLLILFLTHLIICMRFRGTFNGGSDMMTFVVLTGVLIALATDSEMVQKLGLTYIAIHTLYSYFKSGRSKIVHPEWLNGSALPTFLDRSVISDVHCLARWLRARPMLCRLACWSVLVFELFSLPLLVLSNSSNIYSFSYLLVAFVFHLGIFFSYGLNRFFWAWLSAWPATLFALSLAASRLH